MTTALLAVAMLGTAVIIGLVAIAIGVLDHDREADTGLDADWDSRAQGPSGESFHASLAHAHADACSACPLHGTAVAS